MKHSHLTALVAILATTFATAALTQTTKKPAPTKVPVKIAPAYVDQGVTPGFDDLMTMLVQPRHTKLYYAGSAKNWELAAAESRDLRASFGRIAQAISKYEGNDVSLAAGSFVTPQLDAVDAAIEAADPGQFAIAYKSLTKGCNDCHTYMEHPFLVIGTECPSGWRTS